MPYHKLNDGDTFLRAFREPPGPPCLRVNALYYQELGRSVLYDAHPEMGVLPVPPLRFTRYLIRHKPSGQFLELGSFFDMEGADCEALVVGDRPTRWACSDLLESVDRDQYEVVRVSIEVVETVGPLRPTEYDQETGRE